MHLVLILHVVAFGIVLINALSVEENFLAAAYTRGDSAQQSGPRLLIQARKLGYCLRRLSSLAAGTPSGFKGWKRKYHSGYLAADERLYLFFRCDEVNAARSAKRAKRMASPTDTATSPPPLCINNTMADDDSESSGEETRKRRDTANSRIRREPLPMRDPATYLPRPC